jgi:putative DNA primase/helicase
VREKGLLALASTHLNKTAATSYHTRVMGATALLAVARFGWLVGRHPEDEDGERRVLAFGKGNIGPWPTALSFDIEGCDVTNPDDAAETANVGYLLNIEPELGLDVEDVLNGPRRNSCGEQEVKDFLATVLANGPVKSVDVLKEAEEAGLSERTLKRYKAAAGAESVKLDDVWVWRRKS